MQHIKQWFNNHTRGGVASESRIKVLDLTKRKLKKLQPTQAYSRLYYDKKIKSEIAETWAAHLVTTKNPEDKLKKGPGLRFRNDVIKKMWGKESAAVKQEVERYREENPNEGIRV